MYFQPNRRSLLVGITAVAALATFGIAPAMAQAPSISFAKWIGSHNVPNSRGFGR
jgi:hypothetical protein